jgi:hypothetical protein
MHKFNSLLTATSPSFLEFSNKEPHQNNTMVEVSFSSAFRAPDQRLPPPGESFVGDSGVLGSVWPTFQKEEFSVFESLGVRVSGLELLCKPFEEDSVGSGTASGQ